MTYNYITYRQAVEKHDEVIDKTGGKLGLRNPDDLQGILQFVQDDGFYPSFFDKIAYLLFTINKNHAFVDGNKRASIVVVAFFMEINFVDQLFIDIFIKEAENLALLVAQNYMSKDLLKKVVRDLVVDGELSEETKIEYALIDIMHDDADNMLVSAKYFRKEGMQ